MLALYKEQSPRRPIAGPAGAVNCERKWLKISTRLLGGMVDQVECKAEIALLGSADDDLGDIAPVVELLYV